MYTLKKEIEKNMKTSKILSFVFTFLTLSFVTISLLVINSSNLGGIKNILIFGSISLSLLFLIFFAITRSLTSSLKKSFEEIRLPHIYNR